jgi:hypothetical protein
LEAAKIDDECCSIKTLQCSAFEEGEEDEERQSIGDQSMAQPESPRLGKRDANFGPLETGSNASRNGEGRSTAAKIGKNNVLNIKPSKPEWVANFRMQEKERYKNPTVPWSYLLSDGNT